MKSATLLILASAGFVLFTMLSGRPAPAWWAGNGGFPSSGPNASASAPSIFFAGAAATPSPLSSTRTAPSGFFSSALSFLKNGPSSPASRQKIGSRAELRIARGLVQDELPNGLVLNCSGWVVKSATNPGVYAGDGRGMNAIYANLVVTHERLQFGRLMTVDHGAVRESVYDPAMWVPESYLYGTVLLEGYPLPSPGRGKGLKVVAAPNGTVTWQGNAIPVYTASFILAD